MNKFVVKDMTISCRISGHGPALILLHGFGGHPNDWQEIVADLEKTYTVVRPHLAALTVGERKISFSQQLSYLHSLFHELQREYGVLTLAGTSYGGALAWATQKDYAHLFERVILINPMPPDPWRGLLCWRLRTMLWLARWPWLLTLFLLSSFGQKQLAELVRNIRPDWLQKGERFRLFMTRKQKVAVHLISRFSQTLFAEDWGSWQQGLRQSAGIHLICGEDDQLFGREVANYFGEIAKVHWIASGDHMAVCTNPQAVVAVMSKCLGPNKQSDKQTAGGDAA